MHEVTVAKVAHILIRLLSRIMMLINKQEVVTDFEAVKVMTWFPRHRVIHLVILTLGQKVAWEHITAATISRLPTSRLSRLSRLVIDLETLRLSMGVLCSAKMRKSLKMT